MRTGINVHKCHNLFLLLCTLGITKKTTWENIQRKKASFVMSCHVKTRMFPKNCLFPFQVSFPAPVTPAPFESVLVIGKSGEMVRPTGSVLVQGSWILKCLWVWNHHGPEEAWMQKEPWSAHAIRSEQLCSPLLHRSATLEEILSLSMIVFVQAISAAFCTFSVLSRLFPNIRHCSEIE